MPKLKPVAAVAKAALGVYLAPKLAQDAQIAWGPICAAASVRDRAVSREGTLKAVKLAVDGKLAKDADIDDVEEVIEAIEMMKEEIAQEASTADPDSSDAIEDPDGEQKGRDDVAVAPTVEAVQALREFLAGKLSPEDMAQIDELLAATPAVDPDVEIDEAIDEDTDDDEKKKKEGEDRRMGRDNTKMPAPITKAAMDAAIDKRVREAVGEATKTVETRQKEIRDAERFVRPWVGDIVMACDSAEAVYRLALTTLNEDVKGIDGVPALKKILELKPRAGATPRRGAMAHDAASGGGGGGLAARFPDAAKIRMGY
jgi:hypothetical protein